MDIGLKRSIVSVSAAAFRRSVRLSSSAMFLQRINDVYKGKTIKISVPCIDRFDPMFSHQNRRMGIENKITAYIGNFSKDFICDFLMTLSCR